MNEDLLFDANGATRKYGTGSNAVVAVHDVSCSVRIGDDIALVGPSGSGKSTLLSLMAGLEPATAGSVSWPALATPPGLGMASEVGFVFQGHSLLPELTLEENVALPLLLRETAPVSALSRARELLEQLDLAERAQALGGEVSGGEAARAAVARAVIARPRLLLADEPTGQLDHQYAALVIAFLHDQIDATNGALVVATHDPIIARLVESQWQMTDGRLTTTVSAT